MVKLEVETLDCDGDDGYVWTKFQASGSTKIADVRTSIATKLDIEPTSFALVSANGQHLPDSSSVETCKLGLPMKMKMQPAYNLLSELYLLGELAAMVFDNIPTKDLLPAVVNLRLAGFDFFVRGANTNYQYFKRRFEADPWAPQFALLGKGTLAHVRQVMENAEFRDFPRRVACNVRDGQVPKNALAARRLEGAGASVDHVQLYFPPATAGKTNVACLPQEISGLINTARSITLGMADASLRKTPLDLAPFANLKHVELFFGGNHNPVHEVGLYKLPDSVTSLHISRPTYSLPISAPVAGGSCLKIDRLPKGITHLKIEWIAIMPATDGRLFKELYLRSVFVARNESDMKATTVTFATSDDIDAEGTRMLQGMLCSDTRSATVESGYHGNRSGTVLINTPNLKDPTVWTALQNLTLRGCVVRQVGINYLCDRANAPNLERLVLQKCMCGRQSSPRDQVTRVDLTGGTVVIENCDDLGFGDKVPFEYTRIAHGSTCAHLKLVSRNHRRYHVVASGNATVTLQHMQVCDMSVREVGTLRLVDVKVSGTAKIEVRKLHLTKTILPEEWRGGVDELYADELTVTDRLRMIWALKHLTPFFTCVEQLAPFAPHLPRGGCMSVLVYANQTPYHAWDLSTFPVSGTYKFMVHVLLAPRSIICTGCGTERGPGETDYFYRQPALAPPVPATVDAPLIVALEELLYCGCDFITMETALRWVTYRLASGDVENALRAEIARLRALVSSSAKRKGDETDGSAKKARGE